MGEVDKSFMKSESGFDRFLIQNADSHSSYSAPPGWDVEARERKFEDNMISNTLTVGRNNTYTREPMQTPIEDTSNLSGSPLCPAPLCRQFWKAGNYEDVLSSRSKIQSGKNHLHVHPKFLHSNATSHKWAFGAIAELLDNAIDEIQNGASYVIVDKISNPRDGSPALLVQDDGGGMDPEAIRRCMSFGFSDKVSKSAIGRYGNGFKTSTMRLGADVIVFSRHLNDRTLTQSVGLLSYTYLSRMGLDRIVVPMVDYEYDISTKTFHPLYRFGEKHFQSNLSTILQWSPYQTESLLMKQFEDIEAHGTKVIIFNLWFNDDGKLELDFESDAKDIRLRKCDDMKKINSKMLISEEHIGNQYRYSLRVYLSILYLRIPQNFCIILRGKVVEHHIIAHDLKYPEFIVYRPQTGGSKEEILTTIGFLKEAPEVCIHGFNIYHKNRLILPFWQVVSYLDSRGRGVVGILEANFVEPTHDKQDFERTSLFQKLETRLKEMTWEYWDYHCGLIGYQVKKKARKLVSSEIGFNPKPINVDKTSKVSSSLIDKAIPLLSLPSTNLVATGDKRTQENEDFISALGRGRKQYRVEPKSQSDRPTMGIQPVVRPGMPLNQQEAIVLRQEHKKLREKCLKYEKSKEELEYKVSRLRNEIGEAQQEYKRMLLELQSLAYVKPEKKLRADVSYS